ncbi:XkdX family protein [Lactobacillus jensenii]|uniref:XkdX family protein n=1 Tax=Lactobacillus jensenii TaxID=109790 RepID=UPI001F48535E|nr:XkdX family protein [Lactobacillus jensenii]MCF1778142.1 XkdX family protein [Lactobacillus jensenii]
MDELIVSQAFNLLMFQTVSYCYTVGVYDKVKVATFVELKQITKEQYKELTGDDYVEASQTAPQN